MDKGRSATTYSELVREMPLPPAPRRPKPEHELDSLLAILRDRKMQELIDKSDGETSDPIEDLRKMTINVFVPIFVELVEKYASAKIAMQMDASNLLQGGRDLAFEFSLDEYRIKLLGTVTTEAIAFHETRYSPNVHGELVSGPMLRLRGLDGETFRDFVCERLTLLIRSALRQ